MTLIIPVLDVFIRSPCARQDLLKCSIRCVPFLSSSDCKVNSVILYNPVVHKIHGHCKNITLRALELRGQHLRKEKKKVLFWQICEYCHHYSDQYPHVRVLIPMSARELGGMDLFGFSFRPHIGIKRVQR